MNWVEKYVEMQLSNLEDPIINKMPLFMNGVTVEQKDSTMQLLIYQEPFSNIVVMTVYDENHDELYTNRMVYRQANNDWIVLSTDDGRIYLDRVDE
ncbi:hypothetical protein [Enterococcus sp. CWB-B31]|uniref:hypothetical protein n=1 Tax=Enterococcus sp. CWB-B31 TaxID=2885159 RepID=UPI001E4EB609|nr:hypothetical protein [Enterococcus sp. CWB-B31]MCB5954608.1 hypothetical protein [Enterococcus sp. CWB-B31]